MNKMFLTFNMYSNIFYFRLGPKIKSRGATTSQSWIERDREILKLIMFVKKSSYKIFGIFIDLIYL